MKRPGIDFPWIQLISDIRGLKFQEVFRIAMTPAVRSCSVCSNYFTLPAGVCTRIASPFADLLPVGQTFQRYRIFFRFGSYLMRMPSDKNRASYMLPEALFLGDIRSCFEKGPSGHRF